MVALQVVSRAADLDDHLPRRPRPRPDPDGAPAAGCGSPCSPRSCRARSRSSSSWRRCAAMQRIRHDGPLDVWLLDEGDDPAVRRRCEELGVRHFSRKGRPEWNQPSGAVPRADQARQPQRWRADHELDYDVVAQMDPDHVPLPNFLERTLGYFRRPRRRLRRRPAGVRQPEATRSSPGARPQLAYLFHGDHPARRQRARRAAADRHQPPVPAARPSARSAATRTASSRTTSPSMAIYAAVNEATGNTLEGRLHPRHPRRRRGPGDLLRLLQPAEALGLRHLGDRPRSTRRCCSRGC